MVVESFSVLSSSIALSYLIYIGPVVLLVAAVGRYLTNKSKTGLVVMLVVAALVFAGSYFFVNYRASTPSVITIGNGYIQISSSETGTMNFNSTQIVNASVAQIGSGGLTLTKIHGLSNSVDRIGVFRTASGHTAYVVSDVNKDLIIQLTNGNYVIVGNSNLTAMVNLFNQEVYPG